MERRDLIIGFMIITTLGVIVSSIIMFAMSGLGTPDEYLIDVILSTTDPDYFIEKVLSALKNVRRNMLAISNNSSISAAGWQKEAMNQPGMRFTKGTRPTGTAG